MFINESYKDFFKQKVDWKLYNLMQDIVVPFKDEYYNYDVYAKILVNWYTLLRDDKYYLDFDECGLDYMKTWESKPYLTYVLECVVKEPQEIGTKEEFTKVRRDIDQFKDIVKEKLGKKYDIDFMSNDCSVYFIKFKLKP